MRNWIDICNSQLLLEYDKSKTIDNYSSSIDARLKADHTNQYTNAKYVISHFEDIDPTSKKFFVQYLCKWYTDNSMRFIEDATKSIDAMKLYDRFKNRTLPHPSTLSFSQFLDLGDELSNHKSIIELNKNEEQEYYRNGEAKLIVNTDEWKVIIPHTENAAIYFGKNTRWCTSATNNNMFSEYNTDGNLYIILNKKENRRYQFHFESAQFMDEKDMEISVSKAKEILYGPLINIWDNASFQEEMLHQNAVLIGYIKHPSEEMQKLAVRYSPEAIHMIPNPSRDISEYHLYMWDNE